mgnify:CR=1 FL=1
MRQNTGLSLQALVGTLYFFQGYSSYVFPHFCSLMVVRGFGVGVLFWAIGMRFSAVVSSGVFGVGAFYINIEE